jgi:predicted RecA/RadA family phage recombinase
MAKYFVQPGDSVSVTAPEAKTGGKGCIIGSLFGVCLHDAASGARLEIGITGVYEIDGDPAISFAVGERVFWDDANDFVDKTATAQVNVGTCVEARGAVAGRVKVLLGATTPSGT